MILLSLSTQGVKAHIKDFSIQKYIGKSKVTISYLSLTYSIIVS